MTMSRSASHPVGSVRGPSAASDTVATRVCLDAVDSRKRRALPVDLVLRTSPSATVNSRNRPRYEASGGLDPVVGPWFSLGAQSMHHVRGVRS
ncbi:hypothetical protein F6B41_25540 [Microbacterium lushaniae]|nr:hypothetical protein F6B41_33800 [Microbacterium lushaniae]KAA9149518.1 hypothetical protein F6B41_25540 [Microbacterium lushaniae]